MLGKGALRLRRLVDRFWSWYEAHYRLNIAIAAGLFLLQLVHLYWLSADVVATRLTGRSYLELPVIVDTIRKFLLSIRDDRVGTFLREDLAD